MSEAYWETRYRTGDMPWEKGEASPGLVDFLGGHPELARESVCVPGCGTGHDARVWARAGFAVTGIDLAPSAIKLSQERTTAAGLKAKFVVGNFLRDEPPQRFDWLFEHTLFCAIDPAERDQYTAAVPRWLKPGGSYLAINYLISDRDGPPFGTARDELWQRFSPSFELVEECVPRSYPNRTGLELLLWWRQKSG
jgi:SAM-dependent methyltransferase